MSGKITFAACKPFNFWTLQIYKNLIYVLFYFIKEKNEIYSLRPLRKLLSQQLSEINISRNPVRKISALELTALGE